MNVGDVTTSSQLRGNPRDLLYFDNAATSFPKPRSVIDAVSSYMGDIGSTPGRAAYRESIDGGRVIQRCRERVCKLINADDPRQVVFTLNATDALNIAIKGVVRHATQFRSIREPHVVASAMDHNSVLRPLNELRREGVRWTCVEPADSAGSLSADDIASAITDRTVLVVLNHASNVTGCIQDARAIGRVCQDLGVPLLLDVAQTAGHIAIDVKELGVSLLAAPGHKGLLGPLGTGFLWIAPGVEERMVTLREGGTGSASEMDTQPTMMPDRFEPGSHNAPGIAGLSEGIAFHLERNRDPSRAFAAERALVTYASQRLVERGVRLHSQAAARTGDLCTYSLLGPADPALRVGIFTLVHESIGAHELATMLEVGHGVRARAGVHCAPRAHAWAGTLETGALRLSLGAFQSSNEIDIALDALASIASHVGRETATAS